MQKGGAAAAGLLLEGIWRLPDWLMVLGGQWDGLDEFMDFKMHGQHTA